MSHYVVLVFTEKGQTVDELLAPFDESIQVEPYISRTKEQLIKDGKRSKKNLEEQIIKNKDYVLSEYNKELLNCQTDEDFYKYETYEDEEYDIYGNELSTYNPDSKWDWYQIGGRWSGSLKTKDGTYVDECLVGELDLTPNKEKYDAALRFWELVVEHKPLKEGEKQPINWNKVSYYVDRYGTKENFAKKQSTLSTYAVVTPNGMWHEPAKMGWWGVSYAEVDDEKAWDETYEKFLTEADPNWTVTVVDCHI